ncbi:MAG TPA: HAMP domain-containing sensor histidine kinase, partial [Polyangiaceae bacterium]
MTERSNGVVDEDLLSSVFYDIAQVLESAEDSKARVIRVLQRLRALVPYERCALLEALPGRAPRLVTLDETAPAERNRLLVVTTALLDRIVVASEHALEPPSAPGWHMAVPLVGLDQVVGVLFVEGAAYSEAHVRRLSVVAAKLAAYFSLLAAAALEAERSRQLEQALELAETANRAKDEFLALASHELRAPLNTILVWADALRSNETREGERLRAFEAIVRSVRAEVRLIEDLLDLSCIANATLRLELRALEPAKLIQAALRVLLPRAEQKSIRLEANLDESVAPLIADAQRLRQVVANLIANAIKFTPAGGRVEVRLARAGMLARIQVLDTGPGIHPEVLPHVFERFRTADGSSTRAHGGLGLGLALVKELVELHGGHVWAESAGEMRGATFTVDLPLPEATARSVVYPERRPRRGHRRTSGGTPPPPIANDQRQLTGIRVLLVDDDKDTREVLQFVLASQGAVVSVAASAVEAL